jgi:hypothetical protein
MSARSEVKTSQTVRRQSRCSSPICLFAGLAVSVSFSGRVRASSLTRSALARLDRFEIPRRPHVRRGTATSVASCIAHRSAARPPLAVHRRTPGRVPIRRSDWPLTRHLVFQSVDPAARLPRSSGPDLTRAAMRRHARHVGLPPAGESDQRIRRLSACIERARAAQFSDWRCDEPSDRAAIWDHGTENSSGARAC